MTLFSTMIGIIAGLYITNSYENRKLQRAKSDALEQVVLEIEVNRDTLQTYQDTLQVLYDACAYAFPHLSNGEEGDLQVIIHKDSLEVFIEKTKSVITYENSEPYSIDSLKIKGTLGIFFSGKLILADLSQITWEAYKQSSLLSITSFECLVALEDTYTLQQDVTSLNREFIQLLFSQEFMFADRTRNSFLILWRNLLLKQQALLNLYKIHDEESIQGICKK